MLNDSRPVHDLPEVCSNPVPIANKLQPGVQLPGWNLHTEVLQELFDFLPEEQHIWLAAREGFHLCAFLSGNEGLIRLPAMTTDVGRDKHSLSNPRGIWTRLTLTPTRERNTSENIKILLHDPRNADSSDSSSMRSSNRRSCHHAVAYRPLSTVTAGPLSRWAAS